MMKWQPLGKIFSPQHQEILGRQSDFCQSPQLLELDDRVRVYFSTREKDSESTFVSHPAFADFEKHSWKLLGVSSNTVLPLGERGCFDEHGIFPFSPFKHNEKIFAYTCGWSRRCSVSVETGTGLVESHDGGLTFQRYGHGPVLTASIHEPFLVGDSFVRYFQGQFHMWYMFGTGWKCYQGQAQPERTYKIGHAISENGIDWKKTQEGIQILPDRLGESESQALPSVLFHKGIYHMVFCYRESFDFRKNASRSYRLGYAWSEDLKYWTRDDALLNLTPQGDWDNTMMCYPHLCTVDEDVYLLYNGNEFGKYGFGAARLIDE